MGCEDTLENSLQLFRPAENEMVEKTWWWSCVVLNVRVMVMCALA